MPQTNKNYLNSTNDKKSDDQSIDEILKIAKKAEELLRELVNPNTVTQQCEYLNTNISAPTASSDTYINNIINSNHLSIIQQPTKLDLNNIIDNINHQKTENVSSIHKTTDYSSPYYYKQHQFQCMPNQFMLPTAKIAIPLPHQVDANFYATNPPPSLTIPSSPILQNTQNNFRYPFNNNGYIQTESTYNYGMNQLNHQIYYPSNQQQLYHNNTQFQTQYSSGYQGGFQYAQQRVPLKRKFNDTRYKSYPNEQNLTPEKQSSTIANSANNKTIVSSNDNEDDDLNIIRERELKDLKCKSVVEKMNVFSKYYQQFKDIYQQRLQTIECSDSLKIQFHALFKYFLEYEQILAELNLIIKEHEHDNVCKNNHRKTKKLFNKTKAFIRYECYKRLQSNIFEYRRQINSQDRFAGMYDILEMNNYLIGLLPDIGVSIRRYINKCEKAKHLEDDDIENNAISIDDFTGLNNDSDLSNSSLINNDENFSEINDNNTNFSKSNNVSNDVANEVPYTQTHKDLPRAYESFSKGVDSLNRYLLKRVENEESLDELVKERIVKWINKRQSKYILIFSEVDRLLNEHKDGECYSKFHSFLLFNLGKLVTVCDSYHQKLKELLYSTTIRRKKKRKKVKIVPESMSDVFTEINELKRALEHTKYIIKKCNEIKTFPAT